MKKMLNNILVILAFGILSINSKAQMPSYQWVKSIGGGNNDSAIDIIADSTGNVYVLGTVRGTTDFDPGTGVFMVTGDTVRGKLFLAKYNPAGNFIWADVWDKGLYDDSYSLNFFPNGDIMVTGYYEFITDLDPGPAVYNLNAGNSLVFFVVRLTTAGTFVWVKDFGGVYNTPMIHSKIDNSGNIYISGFFTNTYDFDPGPAIFNMTANTREIFLIKLNNSGVFQWAVKTTGTLQNWSSGIALTPTNEIIITGSFSGTTDFDPGSGVVSLIAGTSTTDEDAFMAKYSNSGSLIWVRQIDFGNNGFFKYPVDVKVDADGYSYYAGPCGLSTDLDPGPGTFITGTSKYLLKLDPNGNFYSGTALHSKCSMRDIEIDFKKNVYLAGYFLDTLDADPGPGVFNLISDSTGLANFILALDSTSNLLWADAFGGHFHFGGLKNSCNSIYADHLANIYFAGKYEDYNVSLGPIILQNFTPWTFDYTDAYFGKIGTIVSGINFIQSTDFTFSVYPNPTSGNVILNCMSGINEFRIFDALGKVVIAENNVRENSVQVDLSNLVSGMYFVQIKNNEGKLFSEKLIVKN